LPATVHDFENDVYYCDLHADERRICGGDHEHLYNPLGEP
jgi:hypothetical protein